MDNNFSDESFNDVIKYMENVSEFKNELDDISKTWDNLILLSQLGSTGMDMTNTKSNFNSLTNELINHLALETLQKVTNEMNSKTMVCVDIIIRNLFERTADIGFLATDDDIREFLLEIPLLIKRMNEQQLDINDENLLITQDTYNKITIQIKKRFKEYVAKYSVYDDIVLFDLQGNIVSKLVENTQITKTDDEIIELAKLTQEDYLETFKYHDFLPSQERSLVYTYKITKTNESDEIIGYLSLCFKFEDEMETIFSRLVEKKNKEVLLLLDKNGVVIASSDKYHIPLYSKQEVNINKPYVLTQFAGRDYIVKSSYTSGYEGFFGLGWIGHIMIPLDSVFKNYKNNISIETDILNSIMQNDELFHKDLLSIPIKAQAIQDELNRAVWNGNLKQKDTQSQGVDFSRSILREVRQTGEKTKKAFNHSIEKLNQTIITSLLGKSSFLASLSIDIMDRNLYERANDCRWWALTSSFKTILSKKMIYDEDKIALSNILKYINNLYTVYTNLFIYDTEGKILAVSNEDENKIIGSKLSSSWVNETLALKDSSKYSVSNFDKTTLYKNENTYIYGASITEQNSLNVVGGIGIVFDSTSQFKDMLIDALPKENTEIKKGMFSLFVEKDTKKIISTSDELHSLDEELVIDEEFFLLKDGETFSKIVEYKNKYYIVGVTSSSGYREYKSHSDDYINDILSFVFIEAGELNQETDKKDLIEAHYYNYQIADDTAMEEVATFYIGNKWLGIKAKDIIEAVSINNIETALSMDSENHFKGTIIHKDFAVSVLDISKFVKSGGDVQTYKKHDIVIVNYEGSDGLHTIGILVDRLGEMMSIPTDNIKPFESHLIGGGTLGESIIQPPKDCKYKGLLTLLNIAKVLELKK